MSKCPHCGRDALTKIYNADWMLDPTTVFENTAGLAFHMLSGHVEAPQFQCKHCGKFAIRCGLALNPISQDDGCERVFPLTRPLRQGASFTCPKCGKVGRAQSD